MKNDLSIVIPTHNRFKELERLLDSLKTQDLTNLSIEVLIVSNLPDSQLENFIQKIEMPFRCLYFCTRKIGVNYARNLGIKNASSDKIYFLDDDVILNNPLHLKNLLEFTSLNPDIAAFGGGYKLPHHSKKLDKVYHSICTAWLDESDHQSHELTYLLGGNTLYNKNILKDDLQFNEEIIFGGSETELNLKLSLKGYKSIFTKNLDIEHSTHLGLNAFIKKAIRQGMGRSLQEQIAPTDYWRASKVNPRDNSSFFSQCYYSLYDFFFHVGYRHGKRQNNGPLSKRVLIICAFQTFFQINSDQILVLSDSQAVPFHLQKSPVFKFRELYHWGKGNVWWKIPHFIIWRISNFIIWKIVPIAGAIVVCSIYVFFPFNTIGLRVPYNQAFDAIEKRFKKDS